MIVSCFYTIGLLGQLIVMMMSRVRIMMSRVRMNPTPFVPLLFSLVRTPIARQFVSFIFNYFLLHECYSDKLTQRQTSIAVIQQLILSCQFKALFHLLNILKWDMMTHKRGGYEDGDNDRGEEKGGCVTGAHLQCIVME